jgi:hypothetical protein
MRPRVPFPVRPFDIVPPPVVERAKLIFKLWGERNGALEMGRRLVRSARFDGRRYLGNAGAIIHDSHHW